MKTFPTKTLAASVVTWQTPVAELAKCFDMLEAAGVSKVYVVDNSSDPDIAGYCATKKSGEYIPNCNTGYGAGHNLALQKSMARGTLYHLVMNTDVTFGPDAVSGLVDYLERNPRAALVHPRVLSPDGSDSLTIRRLPTPVDLLLRRFVPGFICKRRRQRYLLSDFDHGTELDVPYVQGSFIILRTEALRTVGTFDERFFLYPEDIDLTRRLHSAFATMYVPSARVVHAHRAASYRSLPMLWIHCVNMVRYFNKWGWFRDPAREAANRRLDDSIARLSSTNLKLHTS